MAPSEIARAALEVFTLFCLTLGIALKPSKSEIGQRVNFLGLSGSFARKENSWKLDVSISPDKAKLRADEIRTHLKT